MICLHVRGGARTDPQESEFKYQYLNYSTVTLLYHLFIRGTKINISTCQVPLAINNSIINIEYRGKYTKYDKDGHTMTTFYFDNG